MEFSYFLNMVSCKYLHSFYTKYDMEPLNCGVCLDKVYWGWWKWAQMSYKLFDERKYF